MTPELVYQKILLKGNKLNSDFNSYCDKAKAVLIVNEVLNTCTTVTGILSSHNEE